tara:strand:- start:175 stop:453 length:279 start_codon:yes stop_codon:yes gene_type:complete
MRIRKRIVLKEYIQRLKDKFKCLYSKTTPNENQSKWSYDANGSHITEESRQFNKEYDIIIENVQRQIKEEELDIEQVLADDLAAQARRNGIL